MVRLVPLRTTPVIALFARRLKTRLALHPCKDAVSPCYGPTWITLTKAHCPTLRPYLHCPYECALPPCYGLTCTHPIKAHCLHAMACLPRTPCLTHWTHAKPPTPRHCERSEAIQILHSSLIPHAPNNGSPRVVPPLAMTRGDS